MSDELGGSDSMDPRSLWQRMVSWLRQLLRLPAPLALPPAENSSEDEAEESLAKSLTEHLPEHLAEQLQALEGMRGAARDSVDRAVADYVDLKKVLLGPGASANAVNDVEMLANAEEALAHILEQAPRVWTLSTIAGKRREDQAGREAAGEALLALRDRSKALHAAASAAIQWAASRSEDDQHKLRACADLLGG